MIILTIPLPRARLDSTTAFNLEYYTEVQDLGYLAGSLMNDRAGEKYVKLNKVICDLVEDYGLVGFETLAVEVSLRQAEGAESGAQRKPGDADPTDFDLYSFP